MSVECVFHKQGHQKCYTSMAAGTLPIIEQRDGIALLNIVLACQVKGNYFLIFNGVPYFVNLFGYYSLWLVVYKARMGIVLPACCTFQLANETFCARNPSWS